MTNTASSPLDVETVIENCIYLIERIGPTDHDEAIGHVVVARDKSAARLLAADSVQPGVDWVWIDQRLSTVVLIGIASPGEEPRVVVTNFRHGLHHTRVKCTAFCVC